MANPQSTTSSSSLVMVARSFKSQWFLIPQGTGILAIILHQLQYQFNGLTIISDILWGNPAAPLSPDLYSSHPQIPERNCPCSRVSTQRNSLSCQHLDYLHNYNPNDGP